MVGRICSGTLLPAPTTRTLPVVAFSGTTTCTCVPAPLTALGRTICSPRLPALSVVWKTTSVLVSSPLPSNVMVWPALAAAVPALLGVPLLAVAVSPVRLMPNAALVPPTVLTRIGPVAAPTGTTRLMRVLLL